MIETAVLRIDDDDGPDLRERLVHVAVAQSSAGLIVATATASFAIRICATSLIWRNAVSIKPKDAGPALRLWRSTNVRGIGRQPRIGDPGPAQRALPETVDNPDRTAFLSSGVRVIQRRFGARRLQ
jgi:hypothetical protein